jgi:hypothetical protein
MDAEVNYICCDTTLYFFFTTVGKNLDIHFQVQNKRGKSEKKKSNFAKRKYIYVIVLYACCDTKNY